VGFTVTAQRSVLESYESSNENLAAWQRLQPAFKFGQVLFLYRKANLHGGKLEANFNNSSSIAVIA
jgi:hypothetical protein